MAYSSFYDDKDSFTRIPTHNLVTFFIISVGMAFIGLLSIFLLEGLPSKAAGLLSSLAGSMSLYRMWKYVFIINHKQIDESQFVPFDNTFPGRFVVSNGKRELTSREYEKLDLENTHYATKLKIKQLLESKGALTVLDAVNLTLYDKLTQQPINRRKEEQPINRLKEEQLAKSEVKKRLINFCDNKK